MHKTAASLRVAYPQALSAGLRWLTVACVSSASAQFPVQRHAAKMTSCMRCTLAHWNMHTHIDLLPEMYWLRKYFPYLMEIQFNYFMLSYRYTFNCCF